MAGQRSPWMFSLIEVAAAAVAGIGTYLSHRSILWMSIPFGSYLDTTGADPNAGATTYERVWDQYGRELLLRFGIPFAVFAAIAAVFLVRALRRDVSHFSRTGHLALAWPLVGNGLVILLAWFTGYCWCVGLLLAVVAAIRLMSSKERTLGDLVALPWNLAWLYVASTYATQVWWVYGD